MRGDRCRANSVAESRVHSWLLALEGAADRAILIAHDNPIHGRSSLIELRYSTRCRTAHAVPANNYENTATIWSTAAQTTEFLRAPAGKIPTHAGHGATRWQRA